MSQNNSRGNNAVLTPVASPSISFSRNNTITLRCLFQIVTGCCIFFAVLRFSPLVAVIGTIMIAPAIIRTGLAAELYRQAKTNFNWRRRIYVFFESLGVVLLTLVFAVSVFAIISCLFGIMCMMFGMAVSQGDISFDAAIVGTAGGMIWGMAGAILAVGYSAYRTWMPAI